MSGTRWSVSPRAEAKQAVGRATGVGEKRFNLTPDARFLESAGDWRSLPCIREGGLRVMTLALTLLFAVNLYARAGRSG